MQVDLTRNPNIKPLRADFSSEQQVLADAKELEGAFQDFVGKTFYAEMLKSMRSTVEKPAYFHGGNAEDVFQSQLDQYMTDDLSKSNAGDLAGAMFRHSFPKQAAIIAAAEEKSAASLGDLSSLRRR